MNIKEALSHWKPPFKYDSLGSCIVDIEHNQILDIRGWGHLTGGRKSALASSEAQKIQDRIGVYLTNHLNSIIYEEEISKEIQAHFAQADSNKELEAFYE